MKKILLLIFIISMQNDLEAQTDTLNTVQRFSEDDRRLLPQTYWHLKGFATYNTIAGSLLVAGATTFTIGMLGTNDSPVSFIGFVVGFGGFEMLKFSPLPLVKAHDNLVLLWPAWKDTATFNTISKKVHQAATCIKVSVACTFVSEALLILAMVNSGNKSAGFFLVTGIATGATALGTSIVATILAQQARNKLGKAMGSFGFGTSRDGLSLVYRFP